MRRILLLAPALAACALLAVAEFSDLYSIRVITVTVETTSGGAHHGYALLVVAAGAVVMSLGAVLGASRPAALATLLLAAAALVIALAVDLPVVDDTGLYGRDFEQAEAQPQSGFYLETAGAALLLVSAVATLIFGPRRQRATGSRRATAYGSQ